MTKKFIIMTSINAPTEAVRKFGALSDWQLVVVGDKKTPSDWACEGVKFLSADEQASLGYSILEHLPWNHYGRKMIGYLYAIQQGAEIIVDTDDDNIPFDSWTWPTNEASFKTIDVDGFYNIYREYTDDFVWPRGYPLNLIRSGSKAEPQLKEQKVGVWQYLADEDPDVDAIYRLVFDKPITFNDGDPLVLEKGTICPFNSQNTLFQKELFPLLYLPAHVTFRFTDILRGLVAQPVMWTHDYKLGFGPASVVQKRNPHDYMKDFISEIPVYTHCEKVVELVQASLKPGQTLSENLQTAYEVLYEHEIVTKEELLLVEAWLADIKKVTAS